MYNIKRISESQNEWLKSYEGTTGFEPMHLDEIEDGSMSFNEAAKSNIDWYETHMRDAYDAISSAVPYDEVLPESAIPESTNEVSVTGQKEG